MNVCSSKKSFCDLIIQAYKSFLIDLVENSLSKILIFIFNKFFIRISYLITIFTVLKFTISRQRIMKQSFIQRQLITN